MIPWQYPGLAFRLEVAKHYSFKAFIIPSEGSQVGRINEEVHSTLVSGGFQVPAPQNVFSVDFHVVDCVQLSWAYLSCTKRMIDDLGEWSSAPRADAATSSLFFDCEEIKLNWKQVFKDITFPDLFRESVRQCRNRCMICLSPMFIYVNICPFGMPCTFYPLYFFSQLHGKVLN